jgi:hypothetical protein
MYTYSKMEVILHKYVKIRAAGSPEPLIIEENKCSEKKPTKCMLKGMHMTENLGFKI